MSWNELNSYHNYHKKMTHHSVMTSSLPIKILKIDKFGDFSCDINYNRHTYLEMFSPKYLTIVSPRARRAPLADTKFQPAAQRKQVKRPCL